MEKKQKRRVKSIREKQPERGNGRVKIKMFTNKERLKPY